MKLHIPLEVDPKSIAHAVRAQGQSMAPFLAELAAMDAVGGQVKMLGQGLGLLTGPSLAKSISAYLRELADGIDEAAT